jgi:hypothetical protein
VRAAPHICQRPRRLAVPPCTRRPEGTGPWTACLPHLCSRTLSRPPTVCLCLCDADPPTSKSASGISSVLRQTARSEPTSSTTHVVATSPSSTCLSRRATSYGGTHPLEGLSPPHSEGYIISTNYPHILWLTFPLFW